MTTHSETCTSQRPGVAGHRPGRDAEDRLPHGGEAQRGGTVGQHEMSPVFRTANVSCDSNVCLYGGHEPGKRRSWACRSAWLDGFGWFDGLGFKKRKIYLQMAVSWGYMGIQLTNDNLANVQGYLWDDNSK